MRFGQFRVPFADGRPPDGVGERVVLGIRPESFEDAAFAPGLPTIRVRIEVLEELGSDAHVFFHVDAAPITAEMLESAADGGLLPTAGRSSPPGSTPARRRASGDSIELAVDPRALPLLRSRDRARA